MPITFETERCTVRPFEQGDIDAFMSYRNNLDWMQFQGFKGKKYLEYKAALMKQPNFQEGVQLAVVSRQTGELFGDLYLRLEQTVASSRADKGEDSDPYGDANPGGTL